MIRERIAKASFWVAAAKVLSGSLGAVSTVLLARLLTPADFGIVALAGSFIAVASALTELSLGSALIKVDEPGPDHLDTVWTMNVIRSLALAAAFCLSANTLASSLDELRIAPVIYAMSFSLAVSGFTNPRLSLLERDLRFRPSFILSLCSTVSGVVVSIVLAVLLRSYWALVLGAVVGQAIKVMMSYWIAPYRPRIGWARMRELWRFSVWLSLSQCVSALNYRADQVIVGWYLGRSELGAYTVGGQLAQVPGREVVAPLTTTLFPALSIVRRGGDHSSNAYLRAQTLISMFALPVTLAFAVFAQPLVLLLMGEKWLDAVPVMQFVAGATAFETLGSMVAPLAMAHGQTRTLFHRDAIKLGLRLPLILGGLVTGGFVGLLAGRAIAGILGTAIDMALVRSIVGLSMRAQIWANRRCIFSAALMAATAIFLQSSIPVPSDTASQALRLASLAAVSAAVLIVAISALWKLEGSPAGPEEEILGLARSVLRAPRHWPG